MRGGIETYGDAVAVTRVVEVDRVLVPVDEDEAELQFARY